MLGSEHEIHLYAPQGPDVEGATLHSCLSNDERIKTFGDDDPNRIPSWPTDEQSAKFNANVIEELRKNVQPQDLILLSMGWTHRPIATAFPNHICCEPGVGYEGILTNFCAYESYAWQHHVYAKKGIDDGRWFDAVIPNYFDTQDFPILNKGNGDYLIFLGRIVQRKGPHIASEIARASGMKLIVAGAGGKQVGKDIAAPEITVKDAEYVGPINVQKRAKLLAGARALIVPTTYIEPFGGVSVESNFAGTPVITSDWGAFTETVQNRVNGFRFRTLSEAVQAVDDVGNLDSRAIRDYAQSRYSLESVAPMFNRWFNQLQTLHGEGWYAKAA